jgi:Transglycosylase SLT domain
MRIWMMFVFLTLAPPLAAHEETAPLRPEVRPEAAPEGDTGPSPQTTVPTLHWDEQRSGMASPADPAWGIALITAIRANEDLLNTVPGDIETWCPAYDVADLDQRAAFWAGLVSVLAWYESTHNPRAIGGGGRWFGLVQIAPATARHRGCAVGSGEALLDGPANLRCGVRIMAQNVLRDGVVSRDMRGVAAEWGPFHSRSRREAMREWVSSQSYCAMPEVD